MDSKDTKTAFIDNKVIIIILLLIILLLSIFFKKITPVNSHKEEIIKLHNQNDILLRRYDSLTKLNDITDLILKQYQQTILNKEAEINKSQIEINKLKNEKVKTRDFIYSLTADSISREFTKYLQGSNNDFNKSKR